MTKIYLAAAYSESESMLGVRDVLQVLGHEVTSRWIDTAKHHPYPLGPETLTDEPVLGRLHAKADMEDVRAADWVIVFTTVPSTSGGFHTEVGMALAWGKKITIVGPRCNVFQCVPDIEHHRSWSQLVMSVAGPFWAQRHPQPGLTEKTQAGSPQQGDLG